MFSLEYGNSLKLFSSTGAHGERAFIMSPRIETNKTQVGAIIKTNTI